MKKVTFFAVTLVVLLLAAACEPSDCVCRYSDENGNYLTQESWDGSEINPSQCQAMENNTTVEVGDQYVAASSVNCSSEW